LDVVLQHFAKRNLQGDGADSEELLDTKEANFIDDVYEVSASCVKLL